METALCHVILTILEESNFLAFAVLPLEASVSISKLTQALQWWRATKRCTAGQVILNLSNNQRHQNHMMTIPVQYPHSCSFAQLYTALPILPPVPRAVTGVVVPLALGFWATCTAVVEVEGLQGWELLPSFPLPFFFPLFPFPSPISRFLGPKGRELYLYTPQSYVVKNKHILVDFLKVCT